GVSACEASCRTRNEGAGIRRPEKRRDFDFLRADADAVYGRRTPATGAVGYSAGGGDDRSLLRVLDVVHGFLMIVSAEHQVNVHVGERAEDALRVFEAVALREL